MTVRILPAFAAWMLISLLIPAKGGCAAPEGGAEILLWPNGAPGAEGAPDNETFTDRGEGVLDRSVSNVREPSLTVYLPEPELANGAAVVICPGGGYAHLAIDKEGHDVARWLTTFGVAGLVLKYRLPRPEGHVHGHQAPMQDARRAIRLARARAEEWKIDPNRIGVMGFSAGGHLASTVGTRFDDGQEGAADEIDKAGCRPDFMLLIYPVISMNDPLASDKFRARMFGENATREWVDYYSNDLHVTTETPPAFLVSTDDDRVKSENSVRFYLAMRQAKVPAELHIYARGGHGYGIRRTGDPVSNWPDRCREWLEDLGFLGFSGFSGF